nr:TonB-dependent receptor [uncultured Prevotella sp.]
MISGVVVDENGEPIIGATVRDVGSTEKAVTDLDGKFSINVPIGARLSVSYIGYKTQVLKTESSSVKIHLEEDNKTLNEVVVVGFGTQRKSDLTGAVSVVTGKDLANAPVTNATQALQGMVPGLQITQGNGSLEDTPSINVRGTTTIGQGTNGSPLILIDGMEGDLNTVNPQDIESISVLKDAAASSIYGSRAPFGVILITTKSGSKNGKVQINYNNSFRWGKPINMKHMMNSVDFASWMNDTFTDGGGGVYFTADRMKNIMAYANAHPSGLGKRIASDGTPLYAISSSNGSTWDDAYATAIDDVDWYDVIYKKTTFSQSHNFSVNGGTDKFNYYTSFNYLDQGGLMKLGSEGLNRYNATAKINATLTNWLKMNYSMRFDREDYKRPSSLTSGLYSDMARQGWPVLPLYDRNGYYYESWALSLASGGTDKTQTDNSYHQIGFVIEPIKNWLTHIEFNYHIKSQNRHWDKQYTYNHDVSGNPIIFDTSSNVHEDYYKENYYNFQVYSEYTRSFLEKHHFHIMGGFQAEDLKQTQFGLQTYGILIPDKPEIDMTSGLGYDGITITPSTNGSRNEWTTAGFFGRLNYDYNGKYLLEVNVRDDGTSRFRPGHQWKLFPSVSMGWNIAQEKFFQPLNDLINSLKLRASYGSLGNQNTNNWYQTYQTMSVTSSGGDWLQNGVKPNIAQAPGLVSEHLTWETIQSYDLGLDWGLLDNRLTGSFDYYIRNTKNMVGNAPELPAILGTDVPVTNNTDLRTLGWELAIGWKDHLSNGLYYSVNFNVSDARTKITRYPNNSTNSLSSYIPGRYINEIWGYQTIGIAKTQGEMDKHLSSLPNGGQDALGQNWGAGDIMYADLNGDGKISSGAYTLSDHGDLKVIGNSTPRYLFGLDLNANYKSFDMRIFLQGVMKRDYWIGGNYLFGATSGGQWWSVGITKVKDYFRDANTWSVQNGYQTENVDAYLPRPLYSDKNVQTQTRYLQNAAYIRLKNMQIGYTIPSELTSHLGISNLRIFFSGENLLTGTKLAKQFDPETISSYSGNGYPLSKTFSFGLSVTF